MKKLLFILILAGVAGGGWYYFKGGQEEPTTYQTAVVTRGELTQAVTATGTLNPVMNVQVGSQISGNIQKLYADYNSEVKEGQVVAQLDPATFQAALHQAEGDLANAQAALELAKLTSKRKTELAAQKAAPQADVDNAQAILRQAEAMVQVKTSNVERARVDLNRCTIYSPIDGIVISRSVDVGQTVAATMNAPVLFTIANDLRKMQIDAAVAEADIGNIDVGQHVDFTVDAFPSRTFKGEVAQVRNAPTTVQNVVTYDTVISVNNDDLKLKPGMTANVSVVISKKENVLKLPNAALRYRPPAPATGATPSPAPAEGMRQAGGPGGPGGAGGPGGMGRGGRPGGGGGRGGAGGERGGQRNVYVLTNGEPKAVPVKLGISDGIQTEVLEGLAENDAVITSATVPKSKASSSQSSGNPFAPRRPF